MQSPVEILEQQLMGPCEVLTINILSMLVADMTTLENFHSVKVVPNIKWISDFLHAVLHLWNGVSIGVLDLITSCIHLELQCITSISSLTMTHLNNHEHIMQMEGSHVLVDCLCLFAPVPNE